jgi:hypothetical protein
LRSVICIDEGVLEHDLACAPSVAVDLGELAVAHAASTRSASGRKSGGRHAAAADDHRDPREHQAEPDHHAAAMMLALRVRGNARQVGQRLADDVADLAADDVGHGGDPIGGLHDVAGERDRGGGRAAAARRAGRGRRPVVDGDLDRTRALRLERLGRARRRRRRIVGPRRARGIVGRHRYPCARPALVTKRASRLPATSRR